MDTAGTFLGAGALAAFVFVPQFTAANIAAFCTYFATFAIFFFTALYLVEVAVGTGLLALLALRSRPLTGEEHDQDSPNG